MLDAVSLSNGEPHPDPVKARPRMASKEERMRNVILVEEEYGYGYWLAIVCDQDLEEIKRRWLTMRGLNCLVPITMIFPTAKRCSIEDWEEWINPPSGTNVFHSHVHQADDSHFDALPKYKIPEADKFEIDGKSYSDDDLFAANNTFDYCGECNQYGDKCVCGEEGMTC